MSGMSRAPSGSIEAVTAKGGEGPAAGLPPASPYRGRAHPWRAHRAGSVTRRGYIRLRPASPPSAEPDALRRPVQREHGADEVLTRDRTPVAAVTGAAAVVAHHEVLPFWDGHRLEVPPRVVPGHVRLREQLAVDIHGTAASLERFAGQPDEPLDEDAGGARTFLRRPRRRLEDDDVPALG